MEKGIKKYYSNTATDINLKYLPGRITEVMLYTKHDKESYKLKILNMHTNNEKILECLVIPKTESEFRKQKIKEAKLDV